jgi:hypothetical protein
MRPRVLWITSLLLCGLTVWSSSEGSAQAQPDMAVPPKSERMMIDLMQQSSGDELQVSEAVETMSVCSAFFQNFAHESARLNMATPQELSATKEMETTLNTVSVLLWSRFSPSAASEVEYLKANAFLEARMSSEVRGFPDSNFLKRYDECSQGYLFAQYFLRALNENQQAG